MNGTVERSVTCQARNNDLIAMAAAGAAIAAAMLMLAAITAASIFG